MHTAIDLVADSGYICFIPLGLDWIGLDWIGLDWTGQETELSLVVSMANIGPRWTSNLSFRVVTMPIFDGGRPMRVNKLVNGPLERKQPFSIDRRAG